jgi:hypothetical protein
MQERAADLIFLMINPCTLYWTAWGGFLKSGPLNSLSTNYDICLLLLHYDFAQLGRNRESNPYIFPEDLESCIKKLQIYDIDQVQVCNYPTFSVSTVVLESGPFMQVSRELFAFVDVFGYRI